MLKAALIDLDGTLSDSGLAIIKSINYALENLGYENLKGETSWVVGPSLWPTFKKLGIKENELEQAISLYRKCYTEGAMYEGFFYPGILEQLSILKTEGYILALVTSKPISYAAKITKYFGASDYLDFEFGSELDGTRSDKTELINYALKEMNIVPKDTVMVGDRSYDMIGAKNNKVLGLGVVYGYGNEKELINSGASYLIESPENFASVIMQALPLRNDQNEN